MRQLKDLGQHLIETRTKVIELLIPDTGDFFLEYFDGEEFFTLDFACSYKGNTYSVYLSVPFNGGEDRAYQYADQIRGSTCSAFVVSSRVDVDPLEMCTFCLQACPATLPIPTPSPQELKAQEKRQRRAQKRMAIANHG